MGAAEGAESRPDKERSVDWTQRAMRVVLAVLLILGVILPAMSYSRNGYADSWAVEVSGGEVQAQELAEKHGFVFLGQVSETLPIMIT